MLGLLLAGESIPVADFFVYPLTLRQIIRLGDRYGNYLSRLAFSSKDVEIEGTNLQEIPAPLLLALMAKDDKNFLQELIDALELVTREKVSFDGELFQIKNTYITDGVWKSIRSVVLKQNLIDESKLQKKEKEFNPASAEVEKQREAFEKKRARAKAAKSEIDPNLQLLSSINNFCSKSPNLNLISVWDLSLFSFWHQYDALIHSDSSDKATQALFAGADPKKIKATHWAQHSLIKEE
jgi:hypothetical protein